MPSTKTTDDKGRVALGKRFANRTVIIQQIDETQVLVTLARVIPEREAWLFDHPAAKVLVSKGLEQAAAGQFSHSPPDLDADAALADQLEGD